MLRGEPPGRNTGPARRIKIWINLQHGVDQGVTAGAPPVDHIDAVAFGIEKDQKFTTDGIQLHQRFIQMPALYLEGS